MKNAPDATPWYQSALVWIMGGLLVWGLYLAIGGYMYGGSLAAWRAAIIFGCTILFLLVWMAVLRLRKRRSDESQ